METRTNPVWNILVPTWSPAPTIGRGIAQASGDKQVGVEPTTLRYDLQCLQLDQAAWICYVDDCEGVCD